MPVMYSSLDNLWDDDGQGNNEAFYSTPQNNSQNAGARMYGPPQVSQPQQPPRQQPQQKRQEIPMAQAMPQGYGKGYGVQSPLQHPPTNRNMRSDVQNTELQKLLKALLYKLYENQEDDSYLKNYIKKSSQMLKDHDSKLQTVMNLQFTLLALTILIGILLIVLCLRNR